MATLTTQLYVVRHAVAEDRRAYERDPVAVQAWLDKEYPAIHRRAKAKNALILWGDEMVLTAVENGCARACSSRGGEDRGDSPDHTPFQREAQECTTTWRSGARFDVRC